VTATLPRQPAAQRVDDVTDEQLLAQVAAGDRAAWGELYRRHRGAVRTYLLGKGQVEAAASDRAKVATDLDDMVQDTFLRAWTKPDDYRPELGYPVRSWLRGLAGQVAWQHRRTHGPYLIDAADWDAIAQQRPAAVESAEQREARPLSEPVRAAVQRLSPAEQRAVQLRYIDGLCGKDAADKAGSSASSVYSHAATARRKLAAELTDQVGPAPSRYVELSRRQAAEAALDAAGGDEPAARAWLREHGVRVSKSTVNNVARERRLVAAGQVEPVEHHDRGALTRRAEQVCRDYRDRHGRLPTDTDLAQAAGVSESTARTAISEVTGWQPRRHGKAPEIRDRTRAAGLAYRDRHGRLPTGAELAELAGVSDTTAHRVLREITDEPRRRGHAPQQRERAYAAARDYHDQHGRLPTGTELARATGVGEHTARTALRQLREDHTATTGAAKPDPRATTPPATTAQQTPDAHQDGAGRHRPRGTALGGTRPPRTDAGRERTDSEPPGLHRVRVTSRPTRTATEPVRPADRPATTVDTYASTRTATAGAHRPPADLSITQARAAVAVMAAHRAVHAQRQADEHDHAERAARWHADDQNRDRTDARSDAEGMCLQ
jgi:RNA polymerase sigma factor (sigma-70 family)